MSEPLVCAADCDESGVLHLDMRRPQYQALLKARFAGQRVDVEVRRRKSRRSLAQNKWLHAAFDGWAAHLGYTVDELKREVLALAFGTEEVRSPLTQDVRIVLRQPHTSTLNTEQFCLLMEHAMVTAAETGYVIEEPEEWKARMAKARAAREKAVA